MKVRELIEALQEYDPELPVEARDVDYGWYEVTTVATRVHPRHHWGGEYEFLALG